jgi:hypothetical protein
VKKVFILAMLFHLLIIFLLGAEDKKTMTWEKTFIFGKRQNQYLKK